MIFILGSWKVFEGEACLEDLRLGLGGQEWVGPMEIRDQDGQGPEGRRTGQLRGSDSVRWAVVEDFTRGKGRIN